MTAKEVLETRARLERALHELHAAEADLRQGRPLTADRLRSIHEELSDLAAKMR